MRGGDKKEEDITFRDGLVRSGRGTLPSTGTQP